MRGPHLENSLFIFIMSHLFAKALVVSIFYLFVHLGKKFVVSVSEPSLLPPSPRFIASHSRIHLFGQMGLLILIPCISFGSSSSF